MNLFSHLISYFLVLLSLFVGPSTSSGGSLEFKRLGESYSFDSHIKFSIKNNSKQMIKGFVGLQEWQKESDEYRLDSVDVFAKDYKARPHRWDFRQGEEKHFDWNLDQKRNSLARKGMRVRLVFLADNKKGLMTVARSSPFTIH